MERQLRCLAFGVCRPALPVSARISVGRSSPYGPVDSAHSAPRPTGPLRASKSAKPICRESIRRTSQRSMRCVWQFASIETATILFKQLSRTAPARLFTFRRDEILEEVGNCHRGEIPQFTGIQIRSMTRTAGLEPDVRLFRNDDPNHSSTASWALIAIDGIALFTHFLIPGINRGCRLLVFHDIEFAGVEPDAMADGAAVNLSAFVFDLFHVRSAFWAAHGARPKDAGLVATDSDRESRTFAFFVA